MVAFYFENKIESHHKFCKTKYTKIGVTCFSEFFLYKVKMSTRKTFFVVDSNTLFIIYKVLLSTTTKVLYILLCKM